MKKRWRLVVRGKVVGTYWTRAGAMAHIPQPKTAFFETWAVQKLVECVWKTWLEGETSPADFG